MKDSDRTWEAWKRFCSDDEDDASYGFYILRELSEKGIAQAQYYVGIAFEEGRAGVVETDYKEAASYYRKAAEQGHVQAQRSLGWLMYMYHLFFLGVDRDYYEAAKWTKKAAEQGERHAQRTLGLMYFAGNGVPRDETNSFYWYGKAAAQNDSPSKKILRYHYRCQHCGGEFKGVLFQKCVDCGRSKDY